MIQYHKWRNPSNASSSSRKHLTSLWVSFFGKLDSMLPKRVLHYWVWFLPLRFLPTGTVVFWCVGLIFETLAICLTISYSSSDKRQRLSFFTIRYIRISTQDQGTIHQQAMTGNTSSVSSRRIHRKNHFFPSTTQRSNRSSGSNFTSRNPSHLRTDFLDEEFSLRDDSNYNLKNPSRSQSLLETRLTGAVMGNGDDLDMDVICSPASSSERLNIVAQSASYSNIEWLPQVLSCAKILRGWIRYDWEWV